MNRFSIGERVRVDIPNQDDPDFERLHGRTGEIVDLIEDDAGQSTGDERDSILYRVEIADGETVDLRWRDVRPM